MPELPTKEEYQQLKERHKERVRRQIEEEKEINGIRVWFYVNFVIFYPIFLVVPF